MNNKIMDQLLELSREFEAQSSVADESKHFPIENIKKLKDQKFMGFNIPREYGGLGASISDIVKTCQIFGGSCLSTAMIWAMHLQQVAILVEYLDSYEKNSVLQKISNGMFIASITTEEKKGGHLLSSYSPIIYEDEWMIIDRLAPIVTGGAYADAYLITMKADENAPNNNVKLVYVEKEQATIKILDKWESMGMRATDSISMSLSARIPRSQVINGNFQDICMRTMIPIGHIIWGACWLGASKKAYETMINLFRNPQTRGNFSIQSDLVKDKIARIRLQIDTVDAYLQHCIALFLKRDVQVNSTPYYTSPYFNVQMNNLKLLASENLTAAIKDMIQLCGLKYGYLKNGTIPLERIYRDMISSTLMYNNNRLTIANGQLSLLDRKSFSFGNHENGSATSTQT